MKKSISFKEKENSPKFKTNDKSIKKEIGNNIIFKRKNSKKEENKKDNGFKTNKIIKDIPKEEKIETVNTKNKEIKKIKKHNIKEKDKNKTNEFNCLTEKNKKNVKKKIKTDSNSKKKEIKSSLSQKNFGKLSNSNLAKNRLLNNSYSTNNRTDSSNDLLISSDNFIKSLLSKYLDGTDNIINEDLEPFNNNEDYENISFFEGNINENNVRNSLNKNIREEIKNDSNSNNNAHNEIMTKKKKKISKLIIKTNNNENNHIKNNIYNSFINSPSRMEGRFSVKSERRFKTLNKKNNINISNKLKSLTKSNKNQNNNEDKESKLRKKIIYSNKIINCMKLKQNNKNNEIEQIKRESIPLSSSNLNLDIIFENNKNFKNDTVSHHYLINTISAKNKMVQKKINSIEQSKNNYSSFNKMPTICVDTNINLFRKTIFRLNRTPKVKKDFRVKEKFSFNNLNIKTTRNNGRKYSFIMNRELNSENNVSCISTMNNSKIFNQNLDDYLITKELGKGSYALVKLAVHKKTKNKYAIKIYSKQTLIDPQKRNTVKNEINILKQIDNESIMKLYEVIDTPSNLYLVLEYINGVNLLEIIKNEKYHFIKEKRAKNIFSQIVKGIYYCHKKNIFHRDIKLENILVLKNDTIKIIDFGFGVKCNKDTYQKLFCGTPSYMPPEIVKKEKYIAAYSDIWSLGVLFYAMLFGIFPFKGKDEDELFEKINEANITFPEYNPISDKTKELFKKIFIVIPNQRISFEDMINILND